MMRSNLLARSLAVLMGITTVTFIGFASEASNGPAQDEAPRGMVSIPGGKVLLGTTKEEIEKLAARISSSADKALLVAEYPQHEVTVEPFYIGETEVTNKQWKAFLDATGSQAVPYFFYLPEEVANASPAQPQQAAQNGDAKKDDAKKDDAKKDDAKKDDAKKDDAKKEAPQGEWKPWENGEIPKDQNGRSLADHPVTGVSYSDIMEFLAWAGMRLPTEAEWELAAKGPGQARRFPWKGSWDATLCQNAEKDPKADEWAPSFTWPVKFNPKNKSEAYGLYDMAGNAWEFTSTAFGAFDGYQPIELKVKGEKETIHAKFDSGKVIKGGGYTSPNYGVRASTRGVYPTTYRNDAIGFRLARSPEIGLDMLSMANQVQFNTAYTADLDWTRVRGAERFHYDGDILVKHEGIAFVPHIPFEDQSNDSSLAREAKKAEFDKEKKLTRDNGVLLGLLVTTLDFDERELSGKGGTLPPLSAGAYAVRYVEPKEDVGEKPEEDDKDKKKSKKGKKDEEAEEAASDDGPKPLYLERGEQYIVFERPNGEIAGAVQLDENVGRGKKKLDSFKFEPAKGLISIDSHVLLGKGRNQKGAEFKLQFAIDGEKISGDWMLTPAPK